MLYLSLLLIFGIMYSSIIWRIVVTPS
jgi:hypothetical protein